MRLLKPRKGLIGVDITSATVKLLELKQCRANGQIKGYQIDSYAVQPLRENAVVERHIHDINDVVTALKRAVEHANPFTRKAVVAIPASAAISKTLYFPASLGEEEIEERITAESDHHFPFPFSDVAFDFQCLGLDAHNENQQQVILVACRQQDVLQLTDMLERAELEPAAVDVATFAMERALAEQCRLASVENGLDSSGVGLVDIGANMSAFHVVHGGHTVYRQEMVLGGRQLTDTIRECYHLSTEEAEAAKRCGGLPNDYPGKVLAPFLDAVVQQVGRSLQLYYAAGGQCDLQHIVLAGGSSRVPGIAQRIADESGMPVTIANPFQQMRTHQRLNRDTLNNDAPAMLTASGLAMRVSQ
ncbi:type IV pilus assembly protein PilM [Vreelandella zhaodongensis]|uniref:Type IV pilus assembly protein PilM n=1 Tax=Vreelandella zhaodongensis TaxID=1176240 RepID=A0ABX2SSJ9_VREZH|nr:type IV pilus assembly protein PilM [Halomonas zhaodongensis]NYS45105.1 type IV pilus assembly protein PilM [Halomonas zhaodongensis]